MIAMPLSVQLLAMSQSSQRTISGFIKTKGKHHFSLTHSSNPDVLIIDIDTALGKQYLSQFENSNSQLITLSLSKDDDIPDSVWQIKKPLTGVELIRLAEKIQLVKKPACLKQSVKATAPKDSAAIAEKGAPAVIKKQTTEPTHTEKTETYDPSASFQGMLRKAIQLSDQENTPVVMTIQNYRLEIYASKNQARLNFPKKRLRTLCQFPLTDSICVIKKGVMISELSNTIIPLPELSWDVAMLCSRGRLPKNLNNQAQYHLKSWPNLTRWNCSEHAMKIASLWSKHPNTIQHIAQQLSISINHVHSFITAAVDSNLAIKCNDLTEALPFEHKKSNHPLFRKLLNRLKRA